MTDKPWTELVVFSDDTSAYVRDSGLIIEVAYCDLCEDSQQAQIFRRIQVAKALESQKWPISFEFDRWTIRPVRNRKELGFTLSDGSYSIASFSKGEVTR